MFWIGVAATLVAIVVLLFAAYWLIDRMEKRTKASLLSGRIVRE